MTTLINRTKTFLPPILLSLLLLSRLKESHPHARGSASSAHRLSLAALIIASKYLYDDTYDNKAWAKVTSGLFTVEEVTRMEMEFLGFLGWKVGVDRKEWEEWVIEIDNLLSGRGSGGLVTMAQYNNMIHPTNSIPKTKTTATITTTTTTTTLQKINLGLNMKRYGMKRYGSRLNQSLFQVFCQYPEEEYLKEYQKIRHHHHHHYSHNTQFFHHQQEQKQLMQQHVDIDEGIEDIDTDININEHEVLLNFDRDLEFDLDMYGYSSQRQHLI